MRRLVQKVGLAIYPRGSPIARHTDQHLRVGYRARRGRAEEPSRIIEMFEYVKSDDLREVRFPRIHEGIAAGKIQQLRRESEFITGRDRRRREVEALTGHTGEYTGRHESPRAAAKLRDAVANA
jgi:hypothetical protein